MGTLWLAELFGLTPDWAAVWASMKPTQAKAPPRLRRSSALQNASSCFRPSTRLAALIDSRDARKPEFLQALKVGVG
jgi:hypothetical protein